MKEISKKLEAYNVRKTINLSGKSVVKQTRDVMRAELVEYLSTAIAQYKKTGDVSHIKAASIDAFHFDVRYLKPVFEAARVTLGKHNSFEQKKGTTTAFKYEVRKTPSTADKLTPVATACKDMKAAFTAIDKGREAEKLTEAELIARRGKSLITSLTHVLEDDNLLEYIKEHMPAAEKAGLVKVLAA